MDSDAGTQLGSPTNPPLQSRDRNFWPAPHDFEHAPQDSHSPHSPEISGLYRNLTSVNYFQRNIFQQKSLGRGTIWHNCIIVQETKGSSGPDI